MNSDPQKMPNSQNGFFELVYLSIAVFFCLCTVLSNILSAKFVGVPYLLDYVLPAGLITYPLTFLCSNLISELFGAQKAKNMLYLALLMNLISYGIIQLVLYLPTHPETCSDEFESVMELSGVRIFASLCAFIMAHLVDIQLYSFIKFKTKIKFLWFRCNFATFISQIVDTVAIDIIFLHFGMGLSMNKLFPIMCLSFLYKTLFGFLTTPLFYLILKIIYSTNIRSRNIKKLTFNSSQPYLT